MLSVTKIPWNYIHSMLWSYHREEEFGAQVQERGNSIANALELRLSCTNPSNYWWIWDTVNLINTFLSSMKWYQTFWIIVLVTDIQICKSIWKIFSRFSSADLHMFPSQSHPMSRWVCKCNGLITMVTKQCHSMTWLRNHTNWRGSKQCTRTPRRDECKIHKSIGATSTTTSPPDIDWVMLMTK